MKKYITFVLTLLTSSTCFGYNNFIFRNANDIVAGTLPNPRLDVTSVTLQGNTILLSNLDTRLTSVESFQGTQQKYFKITIGTLTAAGVDIASNTVDGLNDALARLGARGLFESTTAQGVIVLKEGGTYRWVGATIPAGVSIWATPGSSTVINLGDATSQMIKSHGRIENITIDLQNRVFTNPNGLVWLGTNSYTSGLRIINAGNMDATTDPNSLFNITSSSHVYLDFIANSATPLKQDLAGGFIAVRNSTDVVINYELESVKQGLANGQTLKVFNCFDTKINYKTIGASGRDTHVSYGRNVKLTGKIVTGSSLDYAFYADTDGVLYYSSGIFVTINVTHFTAAGISEGLFSLTSTSPPANIKGIVFDNCVFVNQGTDAPNMFNIGTWAFGIIIRNCNLYGNGTFLSDSGVGTKSASLGNFKNNIEQ